MTNFKEKPLWQITVAEFMELLQPAEVKQSLFDTTNSEKRYVYGLSGLRQLIGCSHVTAQKIKDSGKINGCFSQVGRKLVFDADAVLNALKK